MSFKDFYLASQRFSYTTRSSFLERIHSGSENAWNEFREKYVKMIFFIGQEYGLTIEECEDLMNEVMLVFWKKIDEFIYTPERGKFRSYLGRIASFLSMRFIRKKKNRQKVSSHDWDELINSANKEMEEFRNYLLSEAVNELRESVDTVTFQVFYMSYFQEHSVAEISAVTRKSANTIYGIRSRCIRKLRTIVEKYRQMEMSEPPGHSQSMESQSLPS